MSVDIQNRGTTIPEDTADDLTSGPGTGDQAATIAAEPKALTLRVQQKRWEADGVVSITFVIWFAMIAKYSATRLSAFTFLSPLFGVAAGHLVLNDPLTPAFLLAVALVAAGLVLVNRAK